MTMDSVGRPINVGDKVRFMGKVYTIAQFHPGGMHGTSTIEFVEHTDGGVHTKEVPDEISVDLVF